MGSMLHSLAISALALSLSAAGCAAGGEDETVTQEEIDTQSESLTSVDMVDCSICQIARECCFAVTTNSYCNNFSAERCETLDPGRQRTTKINCLVQLRTTISAWRLAGRNPPAACYIPGE